MVNLDIWRYLETISSTEVMILKSKTNYIGTYNSMSTGVPMV